MILDDIWDDFRIYISFPFLPSSSNLAERSFLFQIRNAGAEFRFFLQSIIVYYTFFDKIVETFSVIYFFQSFYQPYNLFNNHKSKKKSLKLWYLCSGNYTPKNYTISCISKGLYDNCVHIMVALCHSLLFFPFLEKRINFHLSPCFLWFLIFYFGKSHINCCQRRNRMPILFFPAFGIIILLFLVSCRVVFSCAVRSYFEGGPSNHNKTFYTIQFHSQLCLMFSVKKYC